MKKKPLQYTAAHSSVIAYIVISCIVEPVLLKICLFVNKIKTTNYLLDFHQVLSLWYFLVPLVGPWGGRHKNARHDVQGPDSQKFLRFS